MVDSQLVGRCMPETTRGERWGETVTGDRGEPLASKRICLVFEGDISHYSRLLQEIGALQDAGATVYLMTTHTVPADAPTSLRVIVAPLSWKGRALHSRWRSLRTAANLSGRLVSRMVGLLDRSWDQRSRVSALRRIAPETDLLWVIDYPGLPTALQVAEESGIRVLYETVDLVPEYLYRGEAHREASLADERRLIPRIAGFITACDGYADYYWERYGAMEIAERPVVIDNVPEGIVDHPGATGRPLRFLFMGSLMQDRPVLELIEAFAVTRCDASLTFQGTNHLGNGPAHLIARLGLKGRVRILEPCPPGDVTPTAAGYDVGIVALRGVDENERRASTAKLLTYTAAGLAVVASDLPGIKHVVEGDGCGVLVGGMEPHAWASAIDAMASTSSDRMDDMRQRSLESARRRSWDKQQTAFIAEFVRALANPSSRS